ncbi:hypothetical protein ACNFG0_09840 [Pseudomonas sp. NY15372]|uniref:hypothetical protein n=1 Tax=Pseudomonas sp. NY15372 TaxID=3400356 RepID=UPI003A8C27AF
MNMLSQPRITDLRKTMSERALAEHLCISRRQVRNRIEVEAKADAQLFPIEEQGAGGTPPTMTRAEAIKALQELAKSPEGLSPDAVYDFAAAVYGRDAGGMSLATRWQIDGLRKRATENGGVCLPKWLDKHRAGSQRQAMIAGLADIQERITDISFDLVQRFPGADFTALQAELLAMLAGRKAVPIEARLRNLEVHAQAAVDHFGDAGEVTAPDREGSSDDQAWLKLGL